MMERGTVTVKKALPIGIENFEEIRTRNYYYIDKSMMIKELLDLQGKANLFTRPRRFGKTLNLSMLRYYFEVTGNAEKNEQNRHLFDGLKIMEAGEYYTSRMGQYPVINLTLKSGKQPEFELAYGMVRRQIAEEYKRHMFLLDGNMPQVDKERFREIMQESADQSSYHDSIRFLSRCLAQYYGKKCIILLDEYDVPLENA